MSINKKTIEIINDKSLSAREKYRLIYNIEAPNRDRARHAIDKLKMSYNEWVNKEMISTPMKETLTINSDGSSTSEKYLRCSREDIVNPEFLLVKHGFSIDEFELVSAKSSIWDGNIGDGKEVLYSSRITVKPKDYKKDISSLISKVLSGYEGNFDLPSVGSKDSTGKKYLEICFPDLHLGLTDRSGNANYFPHYNYLTSVLKHVAGHSGDYKEIVLAFLGDIFHYDTKAKTTTAGTQQESNMAFESMYNYAVRYFTTLISELYKATAKTLTKIKVVYVPGNHDELLGYTIMELLRQLYENQGVEFDIVNEPRKYVKLGNNIVGFTHGDMPAKNMSRWIYNDAKGDLGGVETIEVHAGHLHHEEVHEDGGVTVRYLPCLADCSPWEKSKGYSHNERGMVFVWGEDRLEEIKYF